MDRYELAAALGCSLATVDNYRSALRQQGTRVTIASLRRHQRQLRPGPAPDLDRARAIKRMRERDGLTWAAIGDELGISGSRAWRIYRDLCNQ